MCLRDFTQEIQEIFKIHHEELSRKFMTHIYIYIYDALFQFSRRMAYAGLVKRAKSHFENCNTGPEETPVQAIAATFWPRGRRALRSRRPLGPNVKILALFPGTPSLPNAVLMRINLAPFCCCEMVVMEAGCWRCWQTAASDRDVLLCGFY